VPRVDSTFRAPLPRMATFEKRSKTPLRPGREPPRLEEPRRPEPLIDSHLVHACSQWAGQDRTCDLGIKSPAVSRCEGPEDRLLASLTCARREGHRWQHLPNGRLGWHEGNPVPALRDDHQDLVRRYPARFQDEQGVPTRYRAVGPRRISLGQQKAERESRTSCLPEGEGEVPEGQGRERAGICGPCSAIPTGEASRQIAPRVATTGTCSGVCRGLSARPQPRVRVRSLRMVRWHRSAVARRTAS
jgi:hypothetical protein